MASWMVHLRIADRLLDQIPDLSPVEFIVGSIAPDSGVPNADWSAFTPSKHVSHFKTGKEKAGPEAFAEKYFTPALRKTYNERQYGFYLGYLTHLMTDKLWSAQIARPSFRRFIGGEPPYKDPLVQTIKEDWYDLDHKYLRDHPGFRAFRVYLGAVGFRNDFMEEFSEDAFDNRRQYITDFYLQTKADPDRTYLYLTEQEMDAFVEDCTAKILNLLQAYAK